MIRVLAGWPCQIYNVISKLYRIFHGILKEETVSEFRCTRQKVVAFVKYNRLCLVMSTEKLFT